MDLRLDAPVVLRDGRHGTVRFLGETDFAKGFWVGVELEEATGKNDGSVQGQRYFSCRMGFGMFLRPEAVTMVDMDPDEEVPEVDPEENAHNPQQQHSQGYPPPPPPQQQQQQSIPSSTPKTVKKPSRTSGISLTPRNTDANLAKRMSLSAASPTPASRYSRPPSASQPRTTSKSPTKPPTGRPSLGPAKPSRPSLTGRTSMPPPPPPTTITSSSTPHTTSTSSGSRSRPSSNLSQRQVSGPLHKSGSTPSLTSHAAAPPPASRSATSRIGPMTTIKMAQKAEALRRASHSEASDHPAPPLPPHTDPDAVGDRVTTDILSPQPRSPVIARATTLEKHTATMDDDVDELVPETAASGSLQAGRKASVSSTASSGRVFSTQSTANREIEELKTKIRVLERKRMEDRDRLKNLEKLQLERDKFESIIQKLQAKYQPQQAEIADLKKQVKEAEMRAQELESGQEDRDLALESATVDREMAEEQYDIAKAELVEVKARLEELELEMEILREENADLNKDISPEERASAGWLQLEKNNERLREALIRLRDITQANEEDLRAENAALERELKEFSGVRERYEETQEKLDQAYSAIEDLRQQLDNALGAEDMIEDLSERNISQAEQIQELKAIIQDLESLKEINDELEVNHVQNEREMQEELDFRDSVIAEQARQAGRQEESMEDMEYTLSRFRELVTSLQSDLEDMRASHAVSETESDQLTSKSLAMMDLNRKLQLSAAKAQTKAIDLELRRLEAQEASQHLAIVRLFLPDTYQDEENSVSALLRFRRVAFKANLLQTFLKERVSAPEQVQGHEDDIFAAYHAIDKLVWVSSICQRFANAMEHCSLEAFARYGNAVYELEPVERALNAWIDGLRRDDIKEKQCASELQGTVALLTHLSEIHLARGTNGEEEDLHTFADLLYTQGTHMQSSLEAAAFSLGVLKTLVQNAVASSEQRGADVTDTEVNPAADALSNGVEKNDAETDDASEGSQGVQTPAEGREAGKAVVDADEELVAAQRFAKTLDVAISQTRSAKVIASKAVRAVDDLRARSLALLPEAAQSAFEQSEEASAALFALAREICVDVFQHIHRDEGRREPFTYAELEVAMSQAAKRVTGNEDSEVLGAYVSKLGYVSRLLGGALSISTDLSVTQEFDQPPTPWRMRAQELKAIKTVPLDLEEEIRRLKEAHGEARRTVAQREEVLGTTQLKVETLEARMKDAQAKVGRFTELEGQLAQTREEMKSLHEDMAKQDRELKALETDRDKWKKSAGEGQAFYAKGLGAAGGTKEGEERAVATAREMETLKSEISSLQAAVRYLREDNRQARSVEQAQYDWLAEPLLKKSWSPSLSSSTDVDAAAAAPRTMSVLSTTIPGLAASQLRHEQHKALVAAEGKDALGELLRMASSAHIVDLKKARASRASNKPVDVQAADTMHVDHHDDQGAHDDRERTPRRMEAIPGWRPAHETSRFHAAKLAEDWSAYRLWTKTVAQKSAQVQREQDRLASTHGRGSSSSSSDRKSGSRRVAQTVAQLQIRLPSLNEEGGQGKRRGSKGQSKFAGAMGGGIEIYEAGAWENLVMV